MRNATILGLVGLVGAGLISVPLASTASAASRDDDPAYFKRDDHVSDLVLASDDDDDDDTGAGTNTNTNTNTGTNTGTNTNTGAGNHSRRGDHSHGVRGRDMTRDGAGRHVDHSRHHTNDGSRHNTRG